MDVLLPRHTPIGDALPGEILIDGTPFCCSLERLSKAIPARRYPLKLTVSARAVRGELWTPDAKHRLPEILDVPGRTGIRLHVANFFYQLEGCAGLGRTLAGAKLVSSKAAVEAFVQLLDAAAGDSWITILDAGVPALTT